MTSASNTQLLTHATVATCASGASDAELIEDGAVLIENGEIRWVGTSVEATSEFAQCSLPTSSCSGRLLTPGLIDCHTHLVYGGDRSIEFEQRLMGKSYEEIARAGGGIVSSVQATRAASAHELMQTALHRLDALLASGVTTVEIKSGYGLDLDTEARCLTVARKLSEHRPISVATTYLGAHALPPEFTNDREGYVDFVVNQALPEIADRGLADAVDGFCEGIAFSTQEIARVFEKARALGIPIKLHAEQLSNLGGAKLAASFGALSADHLEYLDEEGVVAMAEGGTVAVLLPGAFYYLRETRKPPVTLLREHGVPIAIATDLNPGSSPVHSLIATMNMACVLFELTPNEVLRGVTVAAAQALGLRDRGQIKPGLRADLALWSTTAPVGLCYPLGHAPCQAVWFAGDLVRGQLP